MRKSLLTIVATVLVLICSNMVLGFDPMGPPRAMLKPGQPSIGLDYIYSNVEVKMGRPFGGSVMDVEGVEANKIYANLGYGLTDRWDIFGRLGVVVLDIDQGKNIVDPSSMIGRSELSLGIGAGTRATLFEWDELSLGLLGQVSFAAYESFDGNPSATLYASPATMSTEINMTEVQIAFGPTWNCTEYLSVYGGPFMQFIDGTANMTVVTTLNGTGADNVGFEQNTIFGGYVGATLRFSEQPNISCNVEFQANGNGYGLALQVVIAP